jgi:hypothetical protein
VRRSGQKHPHSPVGFAVGLCFYSVAFSSSCQRIAAVRPALRPT